MTRVIVRQKAATQPAAIRIEPDAELAARMPARMSVFTQSKTSRLHNQGAGEARPAVFRGVLTNEPHLQTRADIPAKSRFERDERNL